MTLKIEFVQNYRWPIQVEGRGNLVTLAAGPLPDFLAPREAVGERPGQVCKKRLFFFKPPPWSSLSPSEGDMGPGGVKAEHQVLCPPVRPPGESRSSH